MLAAKFTKVSEYILIDYNIGNYPRRTDNTLILHFYQIIFGLS